MDISFTGRRTDVQERFRQHAVAKLAKIEKLDPRAIRVDVEVSAERNPRQSSSRERVELTITSRGPAIRAEAAAEDRYAALDQAFARLEGRLRRASDRRKDRHAGHGTARLAADLIPAGVIPAGGPGGRDDEEPPARQEAEPAAGPDEVAIAMDGEGPLVVREKFHAARPMSIDDALLEMELVGHDFFLFHDSACDLPSVVYQRRGYQYGVIRLVEDAGVLSGADGAGPAAALAAGG